jgi:hypothetical protein
MKMKTALEDLIQWTIENAFNIEGQDGTKYVAIDHEEMRLKFNEWLKKEKQQIEQAFDFGYDRDDMSGEEYFNNTYKTVSK